MGKSETIMKPYTERLDWIDQLKGFAMIFIVLGHMTLSKHVPHVIFCYSFHIPLFFMISGMTSKLYRDRHPLEEENFWKFLGTKARQLLLPYLLWNIICIPLFYINHSVLRDQSVDLLKLLKGIIYSNQDKLDAPTNPMWFMLTLFLAVVLFDILERIFRKNAHMLLLAGFFGFLLSYGDSLRDTSYYYPWHIQAVPAAVFFLALGYIFMENFDKIVSWFETLFKNVLFRIIALVILHVVAVYFALKNGKTSMPGSIYGSPVLYLLVFFCISFVLIYTAYKMKPLWIFTFIGKNTITYMALQSVLLSALKALFPWIKTLLETFPYAVMLIILIILIPISLFVSKFLPPLVGKKYKKRLAD